MSKIDDVTDDNDDVTDDNDDDDAETCLLYFNGHLLMIHLQHELVTSIVIFCLQPQ